MFKYNENNEIYQSTKIADIECPNCGGDDIEYSPQEFVDCDLVSQNCKCERCGFQFTNFYTLEYTGFGAFDMDFDESGEVM